MNTPRDPHDWRLRVLTWNIHKGIGGVDRRYDLLRIVEVLDHYAPDVALLQEVAQGMPQLLWHDQVALLSEQLQLHSAFHPEHQFRVGGYGNLILSRWPLTDVSHVDLTIGGRKKRGLVQAHLRVRSENHQRTMVVYNLHLGLAGRERDRQLSRFIECHPFKGLHRNTPLIVGGDLNDLWGSLGPKHLAPVGLNRAGNLINTFPAAVPFRPLDGLFFRGDLRLEHSEVGKGELARIASDHRPIVADFTLLP